MKHVTQGKLDRFIRTAIMVKGDKAFDVFWTETNVRALPRRQQLKALRDFMSPKLNHEQRSGRRRRYHLSPALYHQSMSRSQRGLGKRPELAMPFLAKEWQS